LGLFRNLYSKYPFHPLVWYTIVETAMARIAFFMCMPFIAIRLSDISGASTTLIGAVIGFGPLVSTIVGFYVGHLSDFWGRRQIMICAMVIWGGVFFGFSFAKTPLAFAILMALNGLARGIFEPVSTALVSDLCSTQDESGKLKASAFHLRYYAINVGASVGPLIGASLLISHPTFGFRIAAITYLLSGLFFWYFSRIWGVKAIEEARIRPDHNIAKVFGALSSDRALQLYLVAFFFVGISYSQIESILTLHLKNTFGQEGVKLFARLLTLNGATVVALTIPLLSWTKRFNLNLVCALSMWIWCIGFFVLSFSYLPLHFYISMAIMTLGEIVVFANGYQIIESLAPKEMKGAYLGSLNLSQIGMVIGPMIGGYLLGVGGGRLTFSTMGIFMFLAGWLYIVARYVKILPQETK